MGIIEWGILMLIREIKPNDAENFVNLIRQVESESQYMLFESGERNIDTEQQEKRIEGMKKEVNSTIFVAEEYEELIGYLIDGGHCQKK